MFYVGKIIKYGEKGEGRFGLRNIVIGSKLSTQIFSSVLLNGRKSWDRKVADGHLTYVLFKNCHKSQALQDTERIWLNATLLLFCFLFVWKESIVVPGFKNSP